MLTINDGESEGVDVGLLVPRKRRFVGLGVGFVGDDVGSAVVG